MPTHQNVHPPGGKGKNPIPSLAWILNYKESNPSNRQKPLHHKFNNASSIVKRDTKGHILQKRQYINPSDHVKDKNFCQKISNWKEKLGAYLYGVYKIYAALMCMYCRYKFYNQYIHCIMIFTEVFYLNSSHISKVLEIKVINKYLFKI